MNPLNHKSNENRQKTSHVELPTSTEAPLMRHYEFEVDSAVNELVTSLRQSALGQVPLHQNHTVGQALGQWGMAEADGNV